jgi:hypothetical protein
VAKEMAIISPTTAIHNVMYPPKLGDVKEIYLNVFGTGRGGLKRLLNKSLPFVSVLLQRHNSRSSLQSLSEMQSR